MLASAAFAAAPCPLTHPVAPGDTLPDLASFYFGSRDYAPAILIATNSRTGDGFPFIGNPSVLPTGSLCIPDALEATRSRERYATYQKAIAETGIAQPWQTSRDLVLIKPDQEVTVATWSRSAQVDRYKDPRKDDIWVTVEPHLRQFCSAWSHQHNGDNDELTLRLEQRLGLPPAAGDTHFVRLRLTAQATRKMFRPCSNPATATATCEAGPPDDRNPAYKAWFTGQYYSAFGLPRPNLYPWTSLGYTFDWAQGNDGAFQRFGESEFVIPKDAPVEVLGAVSTADYCR